MNISEERKISSPISDPEVIDSPTIHSFIAYLNTLKQMLSQIIELNSTDHILLFKMMKVFQICEKNSQCEDMANYSTLCLNLNSRKVYAENSTVTFIENKINYLLQKCEDEKKDKNQTSQVNLIKQPEKNSRLCFKIEKDQFILEKMINEEEAHPLLKFENLFKRRIGRMDISLRVKKILRYKLKLYKRRNLIPVVRSFIGRSKIAKNKARHRGRFVKQTKKKLFLIKHG